MSEGVEAGGQVLDVSIEKALMKPDKILFRHRYATPRVWSQEKNLVRKRMLSYLGRGRSHLERRSPASEGASGRKGHGRGNEEGSGGGRELHGYNKQRGDPLKCEHHRALLVYVSIHISYVTQDPHTFSTRPLVGHNMYSCAPKSQVRGGVCCASVHSFYPEPCFSNIMQRKNPPRGVW
jgi:hypothetical protein